MVETEKEECLEIVVANAVAEPRAVMIHLGHTDSANAAMVRSLGLPVAALLTVHVLVGRGRLRDHFWSLESGHSI